MPYTRLGQARLPGLQYLRDNGQARDAHRWTLYSDSGNPDIRLHRHGNSITVRYRDPNEYNSTYQVIAVVNPHTVMLPSPFRNDEAVLRRWRELARDNGWNLTIERRRGELYVNGHSWASQLAPGRTHDDLTFRKRGGVAIVPQAFVERQRRMNADAARPVVTMASPSMYGLADWERALLNYNPTAADEGEDENECPHYEMHLNRCVGCGDLIEDRF